jgi:hypothetical protein
MTKAVRALYLLWLPIALLGICAVAQDVSPEIEETQLYARSALADDIEALEAQYGDSVDTTLEGYDHELVAPSLRKRHVLNARDNLKAQSNAVKAQFGSNQVDTSLAGYDLSALIDGNDDDDDDLIRRDLDAAEQDIRHDFGDDVDVSLDGYEFDHLLTHSRRSADEDDLDPDSLDKEAQAIQDGDPDVDVSLEGYDDDGAETLRKYKNQGAWRGPSPQRNRPGRHHIRSTTADEDAVDADTLRREAQKVKSHFGASNVDISLDGYDDDDASPSLANYKRSLKDSPAVAKWGWEVVRKLVKMKPGHVRVGVRDVDAADDDADYDPSLEDDDDDEEEDAAFDEFDEEAVLSARDVEGDWDEDVDVSLEGYDHSLLERRDEDAFDEDEDDAEPTWTNEDGHAASYSAAFPDASYLTAWDAQVQKRDFPDQEDGGDDEEEDPNDRYHSARPGQVKDAADEVKEETGGLLKKIKEWVW